MWAQCGNPASVHAIPAADVQFGRDADWRMNRRLARVPCPMGERRNRSRSGGVSNHVYLRRGGPDNSDDAFVADAVVHIDAVWNVARRLMPSAAAAEDLVQETYLRAYRGFASKRDGDTRSWLVSICFNTARSEFRRQSRRPVESPWTEPDAGRAVPAAESSALENIDRDLVRDAIEALPEPQRVAITLMDLAGLTATEAAAACGVPRGTVLARVHRGRRRLAQILTTRGVHDAL